MGRKQSRLGMRLKTPAKRPSIDNAVDKELAEWARKFRAHSIALRKKKSKRRLTDAKIRHQHILAEELKKMEILERDHLTEGIVSAN